ncbi:MAG: hypothetical protein IPN10_16775 [Saprospiraceae bacterium]|nr:hypothetical protein [Saprospiraceae bacterium]
MDKTKQILNKWKKDFNEIDTKPSFFISDTYGICKIIKAIPSNSKASFFELARPGFPYTDEARDFILPKLYEIRTGKLKSSLQKFKKRK